MVKIPGPGRVSRDRAGHCWDISSIPAMDRGISSQAFSRVTESGDLDLNLNDSFASPT